MGRRLFASVVTGLLGVVLLAMPAGAQVAPPPAPSGSDTYAAEAFGSALNLDLFGTKVTIGSGNATLDSTPKAHADGSGALFATTLVGDTSADASSNGQSVDDHTAANQNCGPLSLPNTFPLVKLLTACSYSHAAIANNLPTATAGASSVDTLGLAPADLFGAGQPLAPVGSGIDTLIGQLGDAIGGLGPAAQGLVSQLQALLNQILNNQEARLVNVQLGTNTSTVGATAQDVTAKSTSTGATVCVIQLDASTFDSCLIKVTAGTSEATALRDRIAKTNTAKFSNSVVTVTVSQLVIDALKALANDPSNPLGPALKPVVDALFGPNGPFKGGNTFTLQFGQYVDIPLPDPLHSVIIGSSGNTKTTATGASAIAASLEVHLFDGLPNGGIDLALSQANAAVSGPAPPKAPGAQPAAAAPAPGAAGPAGPLAFTGDNPWRPVLGAVLLIVAVASIELSRRSRRRQRPARDT